MKMNQMIKRGLCIALVGTMIAGSAITVYAEGEQPPVVETNKELIPAPTNNSPAPTNESPAPTDELPVNGAPEVPAEPVVPVFSSSPAVQANQQASGETAEEFAKRMEQATETDVPKLETEKEQLNQEKTTVDATVQEVDGKLTEQATVINQANEAVTTKESEVAEINKEVEEAKVNAAAVEWFAKQLETPGTAVYEYYNDPDQPGCKKGSTLDSSGVNFAPAVIEAMVADGIIKEGEACVFRIYPVKKTGEGQPEGSYNIFFGTGTSLSEVEKGDTIENITKYNTETKAYVVGDMKTDKVTGNTFLTLKGDSFNTKADCTTLINTVKTKIEELTTAKATLTEVTEEETRIKEEKQAAVTKLEELNTKLTAISTKIDELNQKIADAQRALEELRRQQEQAAQNNQQTDTYDQQIEDTQTTIDALEAEVAANNAQAQALAQQTVTEITGEAPAAQENAVLGANRTRETANKTAKTEATKKVETEVKVDKKVEKPVVEAAKPVVEEETLTTIEDPQTPLAAAPQQEKGMNYWWLLLVAAVAAVVGGTVYYKNKKSSVVK